jgi:dCTP deaminase
LILAQDKISEHLTAWKAYLEFRKLNGSDITKVAYEVDGLFTERERRLSAGNQSEEDTNAHRPPLESLLVYPIPEEAKTRDGPPSGKGSLHGVLCELTLGDKAFLTTEGAPRDLSSSLSSAYITIRPGEFAALITGEIVYLPKELMGLISMRNSYKQKGLISVSGFHVDPGFRGKIVFTVFNAGPNDIVLERGDRLFMIAFAMVCGKAKGYWALQMDIPTEIISDLHGKSVSLRVLSDRLDKMQFLMTIILGPLAVGLLVALISLAFR